MANQPTVPFSALPSQKNHRNPPTPNAARFSPLS